MLASADTTASMLWSARHTQQAPTASKRQREESDNGLCVATSSPAGLRGFRKAICKPHSHYRLLSSLLATVKFHHCIRA